MRGLIAGARGQVGWELMRRAPAGFEVTGMGAGELDIADARSVRAALEQTRPALIINAAAYTAVDRAESEPSRAWAVNRDGVGLLASAAGERGIPLFHISTDYVFAGDGHRPYREGDPTGPTGVYGASKLAGEQALASTWERHIILRTSGVFGAHGHNFVKTMLRLGREREELGVVADQHGCPTSAGSIADALWQLARHYRESGELQWGLYHYSGAPACTWHEFARDIFARAQALGLLAREPRLRAITTADYPTPARRPAWSVLDCEKLRAAYAIAARDWREELSAVLEALGQIDFQGASA